MSRYELTPTDPRFIGLEIAIGWDRAMTTFFGQVIDPDKDEADDLRIRLWVGLTPQEIPSVEALAAAIGDYVALPRDIAARLQADRLADIDSGPTRFQRDMLAVFGARK